MEHGRYFDTIANVVNYNATAVGKLWQLHAMPVARETFGA